MSRRDEDFTQVLSRLQAVREELGTTRSPERVAALRSRAEELVADGERLLGVHLRTPGPAPAPVATEEGEQPRPQPSQDDPVAAPG